MTITFSDHHLPVILAALEAYERFKINQPKTALEQIFPKQCFDLGWDKMNELCRPIQKAFFPDYAENSGPSICSEEAGDARISYEIQKTIEQYLALKKSNGWFGWGKEFDGNLLNPSGLPPPEIEGLAEMQRKVFLIPDQKTARKFYEQENWTDFWPWIRENMPDLPSGDSLEIIEDDSFGDIWSGKSKFYIHVHKPQHLTYINSWLQDTHTTSRTESPSVNSPSTAPETSAQQSLYETKART